MDIYNIGTEEAYPDYVDKFLWIVYEYHYGDYSGYGEAVAFDGELLYCFDMGHGSYYGPLEDYPSNGKTFSVEDLFDGNLHRNPISYPAVYNKVVELLKNRD